MPIPLPAATDPTESLADWMELEALRSKDKSTSVASLVKLLRRTGSTDAIVSAGGDAGSQVSQAIAQDAFVEIENRVKACGKDRYPFDVTRGSLNVRPRPETFAYTTLLLMSINKPTAGHDGTSALFENICASATLGYLGGSENGAVSFRFGSPRKSPIARLHEAIDHLCLSFGEGDGCRRPQLAKHTGDDGLDIVAWRSFPDGKQGKLIAFGQCAAGASDWQDKLAEPGAWRKRAILSDDDVQWVVNDIAELGVKIGDQFFFLYKGRSLVYGVDAESRAAGVALNSDTDPPTRHMWRPVFKREFGECAHPINHGDYSKIGTVSLDDSDEWKPLPSSPLTALATPQAPAQTRPHRGSHD